MNIEEIKEKLSDGNLSEEDVGKFVEEAKKFVNSELIADFDREKEKSSYLALVSIATSTINPEVSNLALDIYSQWGGVEESKLHFKWE